MKPKVLNQAEVDILEGKLTPARRFYLEVRNADAKTLSLPHVTLAEVVAGTVVSYLPSLGISLGDYPKLSAWSERLMERSAWATTHTTLEEMKAAICADARRLANAKRFAIAAALSPLKTSWFVL